VTDADAGDASAPEPAGLRDLYRQQLLSGIGGWSGMAIAAVPTVVFVVANAIWGLHVAILAAVASAVLLAISRLLMHRSVQQALSGLLGVAIAALIAYRTGHAKGYNLFGILTSFGYAAAFVVTLAIRRPLVGLIWEFLDPSPGAAENPPWYRRVPLRRGYDLATLLAASIFLARGLVQLALFRDNQTGWLAVARIAMGYPLTIVAVAFGFWAVRRARAKIASAEPTSTIEPSGPTAPTGPPD
jgi:hypothetical protein